jgi:hypothetical protein
MCHATCVSNFPPSYFLEVSEEASGVRWVVWLLVLLVLGLDALRCLGGKTNGRRAMFEGHFVAWEWMSKQFYACRVERTPSA